MLPNVQYFVQNSVRKRTQLCGFLRVVCGWSHSYWGRDGWIKYLLRLFDPTHHLTWPIWMAYTWVLHGIALGLAQALLGVDLVLRVLIQKSPDRLCRRGLAVAIMDCILFPSLVLFGKCCYYGFMTCKFCARLFWIGIVLAVSDFRCPKCCG